MINGITMPLTALDNRGVKALIGRRVVAAKARGEDSEWPVLGIGTITDGTRDELQIRMYVQFDDDDEIGLFGDEYIVLLDSKHTPDNIAAELIHDMVDNVDSKTETYDETVLVLGELAKNLAEFVSAEEAKEALAETTKTWELNYPLENEND